MKRDKSFTIIEVIVAILVVAVGVLAAFSVVQKIVSYTFVSASRLQAAYLAKEGIEIVRNTRDTNWLQRQNWTNNINSTGWTAHPNLPKFETKKTITLIGPVEIRVKVEVRWQEKGQTHTITAQENLYDWF